MYQRCSLLILGLSLLAGQVATVPKAEAINPIAKVRTGLRALKNRLTQRNTKLIGRARGLVDRVDSEGIGGLASGAGITIDVGNRPITILGLGEKAVANEPFIKDVTQALSSLSPELLRQISVVTVDPQSGPGALPIQVVEPGVLQISKKAYAHGTSDLRAGILAIEIQNVLNEFVHEGGGTRPMFTATPHSGTAMQLRGTHFVVLSGLETPNLKEAPNPQTKHSFSTVPGHTVYEFQSGHSVNVIDTQNTYAGKPSQVVADSLEHLPPDVLEEIDSITLAYKAVTNATASQYVRWTRPGEIEIRPQLRTVQKQKASESELTDRIYQTVLDNNRELKKKYW